MKLAIPCRYDAKEVDGIIFKRYYTASEYRDMSLKTGITFIPVLTKESLPELVEICDGLLVPGSVTDIDPKYYGQKADKSKLCEFDVFEMDSTCIRAFRDAGKKVLGICAGLQSINVFFGGSLLQDIPGHDLMLDERHQVTLTRGTKIHELYGQDTLQVNSLHHQAIDKVGNGLIVGAISNDGIVEEVETENVLAVQWHPEFMEDYDFIVHYFE